MWGIVLVTQSLDSRALHGEKELEWGVMVIISPLTALYWWVWIAHTVTLAVHGFKVILDPVANGKELQ